MLGDGAIALLDRLLGSLELVAEFRVSVLELFRLFQRVGVVGEKLLGGGRGVIIAGLGALGRRVVVLRGALLLARRCLADGLGALARGLFCALGLRGFGCHGFKAVIENEELVVHAEGEGEDVAVRERRGARDLLLVNLDTVPGVVRDGDDVRIGALGLVAGNDTVLCAHGRHIDEDIGNLRLRAGGSLRVHEHAPHDRLREAQLDVGLLPEGL
mmetsp:Transcript_1224/g.4801  ORF Transcript_1224/g.4801 Transcript_1224/m.4801 type:complete len:214 (+) Transcript_1224:1625-2266(+)